MQTFSNVDTHISEVVDMPNNDERPAVAATSQPALNNEFSHGLGWDLGLFNSHEKLGGISKTQEDPTTHKFVTGYELRHKNTAIKYLPL